MSHFFLIEWTHWHNRKCMCVLCDLALWEVLLHNTTTRSISFAVLHALFSLRWVASVYLDEDDILNLGYQHCGLKVFWLGHAGLVYSEMAFISRWLDYESRTWDVWEKRWQMCPITTFYKMLQCCIRHLFREISLIYCIAYISVPLQSSPPTVDWSVLFSYCFTCFDSFNNLLLPFKIFTPFLLVLMSSWCDKEQQR